MMGLVFTLALSSRLFVLWRQPSMQTNIHLHRSRQSNYHQRLRPGQFTSFAAQLPVADAIVVGSGLAGMAAALQILDRGGRVVIIEKEHTLGGNSNKASSGMNACCDLNTNNNNNNNNNNDTLQSFRDDTLKSAGNLANWELINTLVTSSAPALTWLRDRVGVNMSQLVQLGGHSHPRTHRPSSGFVGAEIIYRMQTAIQESDQVEIMVDTRVIQIIQDEQETILGVECTQLLDDAGGSRPSVVLQVRADNVILATGGFASDRSHGSYLEQYRPELLGMPATAGPFSTGDGITLATSLGAGLRDMEKVQIHPTGWVDPTDPNNPNKVLAAELLRGVGGILINKEGKRFCNELGTRAYIADKMMSHDAHYAKTKQWNPKAPVPTFYLVLSASAAKEGHKHVGLYTHKSLLQKVEGFIALAEVMGISKRTLVTTLQKYQRSVNDGVDEFGKTVFRGVPIDDLSNESFYVGKVIPVLHYCMGGITIDTKGNVLSDDGEIIPGLYGAGEVTGGIHGNNRLGGNSLLECVVYGSIVGNKIPIQGGARQKAPVQVLFVPKDHQKEQTRDNLPTITKEELEQHNTRSDCWVAIYGTVYDLTAFAPEHPGKSQPIFKFAGKDATRIFDALHSKHMLSHVKDSAVGIFENVGYFRKRSIDEKPSRRDHSGGVSRSELKLHQNMDDCWIAFHGKVYDLTEFSKVHPGGSYIITKNAGTDASSTFAVFHKRDKLKMIENAEVGPLLEESLYFEA